jgi:mannose/fructose/N-acetylgalactosamine-specific phosphotransferase system component IID
VIVQIAYLLVPVIIFLVSALIASQASGVAASAIMIIGCILTFVAFIVCELMINMGLCHMAYNDGAFSKAFAITEIKEVIDEIGWFECIATFIGLVIITCVISFVVSAIIGIIFSAFGFSGAMLGIDPTGIFLLGAIINSAITLFIVGPYLSIFNSRSIGLLYTMQI